MQVSPPDAIDPGQLRRVLIIKLRHHGDVLLAAPVIQALKRAAPQADIDALVYADTSPMLRGHADLAELHLVRRESRKAGLVQRIREEAALVRALRARRYDLVVHLTDSPRGAWLAWALAPRWAVSHERDHGGQRLWRRAFTHLAKVPRTPRPTVERHLDTLRRIGIHPLPQDKRPRIAVDAATQESARAKLAEAGWTGQAYAVVHPGSRWLFKAWTAEGNARVIDHLAERGLGIVLTAAPDAREQALCDAILGLTAVRPIDLRGRLNLSELAAVIAGAQAFVGVDSVPMHIAAATGTPGAALFGPSSEAEWGPWSPAIAVVASQTHSCRPCRQDGCGGSKRSDCLASLPPEAMIAALDEALARGRA